MCCATCNRAEADEAAATSPTPAHVEFYASLHEGMHALAQPITLLQSYFYLAGTGGGVNPRSQQLSADAAAGADKLCKLFRLMQELVDVHSAAANLALAPFTPLLAWLADDAEIVFAGSGIRLDLQLISRPGQHSHGQPGRCPAQPALALALMVNTDLKRTRRALRSMLHLARESSRPGSTIACSVDQGPGSVEIRLEPQDPLLGLSEDHFDDESRLHLALADANLLGQPGSFRMASQPFALLLQLPVASEGI